MNNENLFVALVFYSLKRPTVLVDSKFIIVMALDIKSLIGEATAYDKKQMLEIKRPKSWLKSVSAFANGEGGTLYSVSVMMTR